MQDDLTYLPVDEQARRRFEAVWNGGQVPPIEAFLPPADHPDFLGTLVELVHIDLEFSRKPGANQPLNPPRVESYLARFPQLHSAEIVRGLLHQEYRVRQQLGQKPEFVGYQARFRAMFGANLSLASMDSSDALATLAAPTEEAGARMPQIDGYRLLSLLGSGGMGDVFRAVQLGTQRDVALKLMRRSFSQRAQVRFEREVQLTARLDHPNIARVFESGVQQDICYYAMELIVGKPLDDHIEASGLKEQQILEMFHSICLAVAHAHIRGVIHRDLKPSNIIVSADGRPHVVDFGLAKTILAEESREGSTVVTIEGELAGTPVYMSPEQAAGKVDLDTRTDVYSLGVILYRLLTGKFPHVVEGNYLDVINRIRTRDIIRPRLVKPDLNPELESLLIKALARSPDERYASAGDLARDVENFLHGEPLIARPATTIYFLRKRLWKHRLALTVAAGILVALAVVAGAVTAKIVHERNVAIAAEHKATQREAEKEAERRLARLSEAAERVAKGDLLGSAGRWTEAKAAYQTAHDLIQANSAWTGGADNGLWNASRFSPPPLWEIPGDRGGINDVALSADGRIALLGTRSGVVEVLDMTTGRSIGKVASHRGRVSCVALTGDAKAAFSGGDDGIIRMWDPRQIAHGGARLLGNVTGWVTGLAVSPDQSKIASVSGENEASITSPRDDTVSVWPVSGGPHDKPLCSFQTHGRVTRLLFLPDGSVLLTAGAELAAWDVETGARIRTFDDPGAGVTAIAISRDGSRLCTGETDGAVRLWDFQTAKLLRAVKIHPSPVCAVGFCDHGKTLLSAGEDGSLLFTDVATGEMLRACDGNHRPARCFAVSTDGRFGVGVAADTDTVTLWSLSAAVESIEIGSVAVPCDNCAFAAGDQLALCGTREQMAVFDIATARMLPTPRLHLPAAEGWAFSSAARRIAAVSGQVLHLWDFPGLKALDVPINRRGSRVRAQAVPIAFSPDGNLLLLAPSAGALSLRNAQSGAELHSLIGHADAITSIAFSPDGRLALSGGHDGVAILWDLSAGKELRRLIGHKDGINAAAFAPDGVTVVTVSGNSALEMGRDDYSVRRWDVASGALVQTLLGHGSRVRAVAWNIDGSLLASAGDDGKIILWQVQAARELRTISAGEKPVHWLAFSATGALMSGGEDGVMRLWDLSTTARRRELTPAIAPAIQSLQHHPGDPASLSILGNWYAFHRSWDWADDTLERAAAAGATIDSLNLARGYWMTGQFQRAIAQFKDAAAKHQITGDYAAICIDAIKAEGVDSHPGAGNSEGAGSVTNPDSLDRGRR